MKKMSNNILVLLSPTKTLNFNPLAASLVAKMPAPSKPVFEEKTSQLVKIMQSHSKAKLRKLLGVSENLATLNYSRFADWSSNEGKQAALAYSGPAFQGLDASSLDAKSWQRLQARLVILSGLYGVVRGNDKIKPYRLCMGTKLAGPNNEANLYEFWRETITDHVLKNVSKGGLVVNCASQEYSKAVDLKALSAAGLQVVDCSFLHCGRTLSVYAKRARGMMVRFIAQQPVCTTETLKKFAMENYSYTKTQKDTLVFGRSSAPPKAVSAGKRKAKNAKDVAKPTSKKRKTTSKSKKKK